MNKLLIFSPLPPIHSGIAVYVAKQLLRLSKFQKVTCVIEQDSYEQKFADNKNILLIKYESYVQNREKFQSYTKVYHVGNNSNHFYVYQEAIKHPGVVFLHDLVLHHMLSDNLYEKNDKNQYKQLLAFEVGDKLSEQIYSNRINRIWCSQYLFLIPLSKYLISVSLVVIVHSRWMEKKLKQLNLCEIKYIPHFADNSFIENETNLKSHSIVISSFGYVTQAKQISFALLALGKLKKQGVNFIYYIVGEISETFDIKNEINRNCLVLEKDVFLIDYVSDNELEKRIMCSDIIINLRFPSAGETSGILISSMLAAKPCIVFDYFAFSDFPDDVICKIDLNTFNSANLTLTLEKLLKHSDIRDRIGRNAKAFITKNNIPEDCDKKLLQICEGK